MDMHSGTFNPQDFAWQGLTLTPAAAIHIRELVAKLGLKPIKNPCPYDGHTMRQDIKEHIAALNAQYPEIYEHLAAAMRDSDRQELWPPKPGKELLQKFHTFWGRGKKQAEQ